KLSDFLESLFQKDHIKKLGIDENNLTVLEYKFLRKIIKKLFNFSTDEIRQIKTSPEINSIKKACQIADQAFLFAVSKLKIGATEKEIAYEFENFLKKQGAEISFDTI